MHDMFLSITIQSKKEKIMNDLLENIGLIIKLIMAIAYPLAIIKIMMGAYNIKQGENGLSDIVGGSLIAIAPTVMYFIYEGFNMLDSAALLK